MTRLSISTSGRSGLSPHGMGIAIGFLLGARVMLPASGEEGHHRRRCGALLVRAAIGAIIGARLAYVLNHPGDYTDNPLEIIHDLERRHLAARGFRGGDPRRRAGDAKAQASPSGTRWTPLLRAWRVGVIIGRIGDLVVADHLGKPTELRPRIQVPALGRRHRCAVHRRARAPRASAGVVRLRPDDHRARSCCCSCARRSAWDGFLIITFGVLLRHQPIHRGLVPRRRHPRHSG